MKITYYICHHRTAHGMFAFRAKTKKECVAFFNDADRGPLRRELYAPPVRVVVEYADAFDLIQRCVEGDTFEPEETSRVNREKL